MSAKPAAAVSGRDVVPKRHERNPDEVEPISAFRFFAIVGTWNEEDVIEATVRNAMIQGVETVFVVDNGSTDGTVRNAEAAGATIAEVFDTVLFDLKMKHTLMNGVVARESLRCGSEHVWWLYLDGDEFPEGPEGSSLEEYLRSLDKRFRIAGAKCFNHLPNSKPEYLSGFHPIDFQPLCYEFLPTWESPCGQIHWKHPLQRFDRSGYFLQDSPGSHWAMCRVPISEPTGGIVIHHFQYRDEEKTRARLRSLCAGPRLAFPLHRDHFDQRRRSLDAVYSQRWEDVETSTRGTDYRNPLPWPGLSKVRRWYDVPPSLGMDLLGSGIVRRDADAG